MEISRGNILHHVLAFLPKLNTGNRVATILAGIETFLDSQVGCRELILSPVERSTSSTFRVASNGLVVWNDAIIHSGESRILVDVETIVGSARFRRISRTWCIALGFVDLGAIDGSTAETFGCIKLVRLCAKESEAKEMSWVKMSSSLRISTFNYCIVPEQSERLFLALVMKGK
jgi:hypothetical protein